MNWHKELTERFGGSVFEQSDRATNANLEGLTWRSQDGTTTVRPSRHGYIVKSGKDRAACPTHKHVIALLTHLLVILNPEARP